MSTQAAQNGSWVCQLNGHDRSRGIFFGDSPFSYGTPILLAQLSLSSLLTSLLQCILTPLGQSSFVSQMLVGLVLGPSFFGRDYPILQTIFPYRSFYVSETLAFFGCLLFMFLVGVKMDLTIMKKCGTKPIVIGACAFFVPLAINTLFSMFLQNTISMETHLKNSLHSIAAFQSSSSFYVIACLLTDLKLLNSELGRLALSSSMISGTLTWIFVVIGFSVKQTTVSQSDSLLWMVLCVLCLVILIIYIMRPIMFWMISHSNHPGREKAIKESYIFSIFIMVLICALFSEFIGQHFMLGPMILGLAVPDGPPLGSALVDKLDSFVSSILLPCYFVVSGARINLAKIEIRTAGIVHLLAFCGFLGKLIGTMVPCLYCKMSFLDSFNLGLIMSTQGITDILILQHGMLLYMIDAKSYSIMVIAIILMTGMVSPIVKFLYNPSKRYKSGRRRRTIEHASSNGELRLIACIHHQDNTPSIINLLEISNPTSRSPICFYIMHLIQLTGRSSPLFINHRAGQKDFIRSDISDHIINAFEIYQQSNFEKVIMNAFTSIAPFATMHDDVCMLALEKRTAMIILPFHKRRTLNGMIETTNPIRTVNNNILSKAPCSVGILIDRGKLITGSSTTISLSNRTTQSFKIGMIFVEGADDREALAYASRMAEHPNVTLTLVHLIEEAKRKTRQYINDELDMEMINEFKIGAVAGGKNHRIYEEERVSDCVGIMNVIRRMEKNYDMILVGRRHDQSNKSDLFMGLNEWNEYEELGFMGDMLISSDNSNPQLSVLVIQQQSIGNGEQDFDDFKCLMEESFSVDIAPLNPAKPWPKSS